MNDGVDQDDGLDSFCLPKQAAVSKFSTNGLDVAKHVVQAYALVDTDDYALKLQIRPAWVQDRGGAVKLLRASRASFLFVELLLADNACAGDRVARATGITVTIVRKLDACTCRRETGSPALCVLIAAYT